MQVHRRPIFRIRRSGHAHSGCRRAGVFIKSDLKVCCVRHLCNVEQAVISQRLKILKAHKLINSKIMCRIRRNLYNIARSADTIRRYHHFLDRSEPGSHSRIVHWQEEIAANAGW